MWFLFLPTVIIEIFCLVARAPGNYFAVNVVQVSLLVVALMSAFYVFIARWRLRGNVRNITMTAISILYVFVLIPSTAFLSVSKFLFDAYGSTDTSDIVASTFVICLSVCLSSVFSIAFVYVTDVLLSLYPSKAEVAPMFVKTYENIQADISDVQSLAQETRIAVDIFRKQSQTYLDDINALEENHASALQKLEDSMLITRRIINRGNTKLLEARKSIKAAGTAASNFTEAETRLKAEMKRRDLTSKARKTLSSSDEDVEHGLKGSALYFAAQKQLDTSHIVAETIARYVAEVKSLFLSGLDIEHANALCQNVRRGVYLASVNVLFSKQKS